MPTLPLAIDASRARQGAQQFTAATDKVTQASTRAGTQLRDSRGRFIQSGQAATTASRGLATFHMQITQIASTLFAGIGIAAFSTALRNSVGAAIAYESALNDAWSMVDQGRFTVQGLGEDMTNLAITFGTTRQDQARQFYEIMASGAFDAAEATELLDVANRLAIGGITELETGVDVLTTLMGAYGDQVDSVEAVSDALFIASRGGKADIDGLSRSLGRIAPIAAAAGLSVEEMSAGVGALSTVLPSAAEATTGMRQALNNIIDPSNQALQIADELGLNFGETAFHGKSFGEVMTEIAETVENSDVAMTDLFTSVEAQTAAFAFAGRAGDQFNDIMADMGSAAGTTQEAFEIVSETIADDLSRIGAAARVAMEEFALLGLQGIRPLLTGLADSGQTIRDVMVPALLGMSAALGTALTPMILRTTAATAAWAASFMLTPFGFMITSVGLLTAAIASNEEVTNAALGVLSAAWEGFQEVALMAWNMVAGAVTSGEETVHASFGGMVSDLVGLGNEFDSWSEVVASAFVAVEFGLRNFGAMFDVMTLSTARDLSLLGDMFTSFFSGVLSRLGFLRDNWRDIFTDIGNIAKTVFENLSDLIIDQLGTVWGVLTGEIGIQEGMGQLGQNMGRNMLEGFESAIDGGQRQRWSNAFQLDISDRSQELTRELDQAQRQLGQDFRQFRDQRMDEIFGGEGSGGGGGDGDTTRNLGEAIRPEFLGFDRIARDLLAPGTLTPAGGPVADSGAGKSVDVSGRFLGLSAQQEASEQQRLLDSTRETADNTRRQTELLETIRDSLDQQLQAMSQGSSPGRVADLTPNLEL